MYWLTYVGQIGLMRVNQFVTDQGSAKRAEGENPSSVRLRSWVTICEIPALVTCGVTQYRRFELV